MSTSIITCVDVPHDLVTLIDAHLNAYIGKYHIHLKFCIDFNGNPAK